MCVCLYVCMCAGANRCTRMCKTEDKARHCSSVALHPLNLFVCFFETASLIETWSSSIKLCWLAGQRASQIFLSLPAFYVGARDARLVLLLASKHFLS